MRLHRRPGRGRDRTTGRHPSRRRLVLLGTVGAAVVTGAVMALAASPTPDPPAMTAVSPSATYTTLTVALSQPLHASVSGTTTTPLVSTSAWTVRTGTTTVAPTAVTGSASSYVLTVPTATVTPNVSSVVLLGSKAVDATGTVVSAELAKVVPLTAADAAKPLSALSAVKVDGKAFGPLPFVGTWFQNVAPVAGPSTAVVPGAVSGATEPPPVSATAQLASTPRPLTALLPTLADAITLAGRATTQDGIAAALTAVPGIGAVSFSGADLTLAFEPSESSGTWGSTQRTDVAALPYAVDGTTTFDLHLRGSLTLTSGTAGAALKAIDLSMEPRAVTLPATARIGMVTVTPEQAVVVDALAAKVVCSTSCGTGTTRSSVTGSVRLDLSAVSYDDSAAAVTRVALTSGTTPLGVQWSPATWDLAGLVALTDETSTASRALLATTAPVVTGDSAFRAAELPQFATLDTRAFVMGLEWVGSWLRSLDGVEGFGTELPAVGLTVGDVLTLSDQVGAEVTQLISELEGDGTAAGRRDPSAQDLVATLCRSGLMTCGTTGALQGLTVTPDAITYDVRLSVCRVLFEATGDCPAPGSVAAGEKGPTLDLAVGDDMARSADLGPLGGISTTLSAGTWQGTASATLAFQLRMDLRSKEEIKTALGLTEAQAVVDPGHPARDWIVPGDLCRGVALGILPGYSTTAFASANKVLSDGEPTAACDTLAWTAGGTVLLPGVDDAADTAHTVTDEEVCRGVGLKHARALPDFLADNPSLAGTAAAPTVPVTACAALAKQHLLAASTAAREALPPFVYYVPPPGAPLSIGHRLSIAALGTEPLAATSVGITGTGLGGTAQLGLLDLGLTGSATVSPTVALTLTNATGKPLTLAAMASAADAAKAETAAPTGPASLTGLVEATLGGSMEVDLDLANALAFPTAPAQFRLQGDVADLVRPSTITVDASCADLTSGETGLCYSLGEWTGLRATTPAQVVRMVTGLLDRLAGVTSTGDAAFALPFVGVSVQDLVAFDAKLRVVAETVEGLDPQSLTGLQSALAAGLVSAGLPAELVTVDIETYAGKRALLVAVPLSVQESASYPFGFDVGFGEDGPLPVRIAPSDGGAQLTAQGRASVTPTLGLMLDGAVTDALDDRVFLAVDEATDPTLSGTVSAEVAGDITFGPLSTDLSGRVEATPSVTVALSALGTDGRLTLSRLSDLLVDGVGSSLTWGGALSVDAAITGPAGPLELEWSADLADLVDGGTGSFAPGKSPADWELAGLKLDLETLVRGTSQTSRFVGRALASSDALSTSLPLVGDELAKLSQVGKDLQTFSTAVDELWATVEEEEGPFVDGINETLQEEVCAPLAAAGTCEIALRLYDDDGEEVGIGNATRVELGLTLEQQYLRTLDTPKLLDVPGFELDTRANLEVTAGYRLGLTLGLSLEDGFYVKGFDLDGEDEATRLLEIYGKATLQHSRAELDAAGGSGSAAERRGLKVGGVTVFTLEEIDLGLTGTLGPDGTNAAGFALDMPSPLTLSDITSRRRTLDSIFEPRISVAATAKIVIQTPDDLAKEVPVLRFPVHFDWTVDAVLAKGLELPSPHLSIGKADEDSFVAIDASGLLEGVVKPALVELNKYNPVAQAKPVRDALNTEIPVVDQTVRSMLDVALSSDASWKLFGFLLDLDEVATSLQDDPTPMAKGTFVDLGGYTVLPKAESGFFEPETGGVWAVPELAFIRELIGTLSSSAGGSKTFTPPAPQVPAKPGAPRVTTGPATTTFTGTPPKRSSFGQIVSMPILDNPMSAATLLFGGEVDPVSFIEIAPPPVDFGLSIKFSRTLFKLDVAFLEAELSVGLEGAVGVVLRVGVGYSSHGLTSGNPVNGLYLVDAYDGERDLPLIALGGRVSARVDGRFAVLGIAEATFSGSGYVRLEGGLDLYDESPAIPEAGRGDGMFHVDEMARVIKGHRIDGPEASLADAFCIFRPTVNLEAGLAFGGSATVAGIKVWSGSWAQDWVLVDESITCPEAPRVAQLEERRLVLNAGPYAADRLDGRTIADEGFTIDLWTDTTGSEGKKGTQYLKVSGAAGLAGSTYDSMLFAVDAVEEIYADLGAGADTVTIATDVTTPANLFGGAGNDTLKGGGGDDLLDGGTGTDRIETRAGNDTVVIGSDGSGPRDVTSGNGLGSCTTGCNVVVLGSGDDLVRGGPSAVVYQPAPGGVGNDRIEHEGTSMVLDLGTSSAGVTGVVDGLGGRFTSSAGVIETSDPTSMARLLGSAGADDLRVLDGPVGMYVDGGPGTDTITVETNGNDRTVRAHDYGADGGAKTDTLVVQGTTGSDKILLRARVKGQAIIGPDRGGAAAKADEGVVAVLSRDAANTKAVSPTAPSQAPGGPVPVSHSYTGSASATQLVFYDSSFKGLQVDGVAGEDDVSLDDVATATTIQGGRGSGTVGSHFQVGQIFGWNADTITPATAEGVAAVRTPTSPSSPVGSLTEGPWGDDQFRYRESIRGWLSFGISHPTTVSGGDGNDEFTVYSNRDKLTLEGGGGDNTFTLRSFISNGSIKATGGDGNDTFKYDFEYVANNEVAVDGGAGFNTFVAIGTELQDGFTVTPTGVSVCVPSSSAPGVATLDARLTRSSTLDEAAIAAGGLAGTPGLRALPRQPVPGAPVSASGACAIDSAATNVQRYVLYGLQGNDVFWVRGAPSGSETYLIGGEDGSSYVVGDAGDLSRVDGTVEVVADLRNLSPAAERALASVDLAFPEPLLLAGDVAYSPVDALIPGDAVDKTAKHTAYVDGSAMTAGQSGTVVREGTGPTAGIRIAGLTDAAPETFGLAELGPDGLPRSYTVQGGIGLRGLDRLRVVLGSGDDVLEAVGTHAAYALPAAAPYAASAREGRTEVHTGGGADRVQLDAVDGPTWVWTDGGGGTVRAGTGTAAGVTAPLEVYGGDGVDVVEIDSASRTVPVRADVDLRTARPRSWGGVLATTDVVEVTGLEMTAPVRHDASVDVLRVKTGTAADDVNVRGTLAGSTELRTAGADDRVFVSSAEPRVLGAPVPGLLRGTLDDIRGGVDLDAAGGDNLLMVSDRDSTVGRTATGTDRSLAVTGLGAVTYTATGGSFAQGVTTWFGAKADTVTVTGARRDGADRAVLAWEGRSTIGAVRTTTTLSTGAGNDAVTVGLGADHGVLVVNLEQGDDSLLGGASTLGFTAFGGDGADRIQGGSGDDLVFGDWGHVDYRGSDGALTGVLGVPDRMDLVSRIATAPRTVETCTTQPTAEVCAVARVDLAGVKDHGLAASVRNWISVGAGDDVAFGGGGADWIDASGGRNALVGDHGRLQRVTPAELGGARRVTTSDGAFDVAVLEESFGYDVEVLDALGGARDVVLGGTGRDWVFAGLGDDLVNGGDGSDLVFGGDGSDVVWGGLGDDRVYAGFGDDLVDLKAMTAGQGKSRTATRDGWPIGTWWKGSPLVGSPGWAALAPVADTDLVATTVNGSDLVFGGDGPDALQADVGGAGPVPGDRLVDWNGAYNVFLVCDGAYGRGYVLRVPSPSTVRALQELARADGAAGTDGTRQLAIPLSGNNSPTHPAHPGNNLGC